MSFHSRDARAVVEWAKAEIAPLVVLLAAAVLALGFVLLADEVFEGSTAAFDRDLLLAFRTPGNVADAIGPPWLEEAARDLTALGSYAVLGIVVLASIVYLALAGQRKTALLVAMAVVGGVLLTNLLKLGFARPRPDLVVPLARVFTTGFPSGHAALSATVYLTLGALLARFAETRQLKLYFVSLAVGLTLIVGVTRVYLGLHYPTDVLAGWCIGAAWAMICWAVALYLQRSDILRPGQQSPLGANSRSAG